MSEKRLHMAEAIEIVLADKDNFTMHASDIAGEIERRRLYIQRNGKYPVYNAIRSIAGKRPDLFDCLSGNYIRLKKRLKQ